ELVAGCEVGGGQRRERRLVEAARVTGRGEQSSGTVDQRDAAGARFGHEGLEDGIQLLEVRCVEKADRLTRLHPAPDAVARSASWRSMRARIWAARRRSSPRGSHATKSRSSCTASTEGPMPAM